MGKSETKKAIYIFTTLKYDFTHFHVRLNGVLNNMSSFHYGRTWPLDTGVRHRYSQPENGKEGTLVQGADGS